MAGVSPFGDLELCGAPSFLRHERDLRPELLPQGLDRLRLLGPEPRDHVGMGADLKVRRLTLDHQPLRLPQNLMGDGGDGPEQAGSPAVGTAHAEGADETLLDPLAGHLDQAQFREESDVGGRAVGSEALLEFGDHPVPVILPRHVDEVDDDNPPQVPEAHLTGNLARRFQIRLEDGLFEVVFADVAPGVDIDRDQRLGLLDDEIPPRFQPDLGPQGLFDLALDPEGPKDGLLLGVEEEVRAQIGEQRLDKLYTPFILPFVVHHQPRDIAGEEVAEDPKDEIEIPLDQGRRRDRLGPRSDLSPERAEKLQIGGDLIPLPAHPRGSDYDPFGPRSEFLYDLSEAGSLPLALDLPIDADLLLGWHVDQIAGGGGGGGGGP